MRMRIAGIALVPMFFMVFNGVDNLRSELRRLHVHTALLVRSQAIDDSPVWSPDSRYIGANIQGKWFKVDLSRVNLLEATWHGERLGSVGSEEGLEPITKGKARDWDKVTKHGNTYFTGKSGVRAEFNNDELSTFLTLSKGTQRVIVFKSDIESCGAPTFSPDEEFLAYICETNGVLVTDVGEAFSTAKNHD